MEESKDLKATFNVYATGRHLGNTSEPPIDCARRRYRAPWRAPAFRMKALEALALLNAPLT